MPTLQEIEGWRGRTAVDADGDKIGSIEDIYLDRRSGDPEWIAVKTGLLGKKVSFVPLSGAEPTEDDVRVAYPKDLVKDAPSVDPDGELSPEEERRLYEHYERTDYGDWTDDSEDRTEAIRGRDRGPGDRTDTAAGGGTATAAGRDVDSEGTDDAITRSDEELRVGTEARETGRARLRKYVTTEQETRTVPVRREDARVEREPITDDNIEQAMSGPEISEAEHEVVLRAEEPVVEKRVEPKERVRLEKDVRTDEHTVSEDVRKEHVESDGDVEDNR
jgi:uncharacterized protein (TIGR02271 family)